MSKTGIANHDACPPADWNVIRLADIADIRISNVDKKSVSAELPVRLCNYMDVYGNEYIRSTLPFMEATANPVEIARFTVERGDVLATKDSETPDDIGVPAVVTDEIPNLVCGYHLAQIKPQPNLVDSVFLSKQIGHQRVARWFSRLANGSTRYGLATSSFENLEVWLPQLLEQRKIARILTTLDELIQKTEALIAKYQAIKQGMMHDLFTRGVDEHGHLRPTYDEAPELYKESELGWIPREWKIDLIENVLERIIDYRGKTPTKTDCGVPLITAKNVRMGFIDSEPMEFIAEDSFDIWMTRGIPVEGDVLFTTEAPLGNVAQITTDRRLAFAQRVIILQTSSRICNSFLNFLLMTDAPQRWIRTKGTGSTVEGIKQSVFRRLPIAFPNRIEEQTAIVVRIESLARQLVKEQNALRKYQVQKNGLMQDLLTGKVRVKVGEFEEDTGNIAATVCEEEDDS